MIAVLTLPFRLLAFTGWFAWQILRSSGGVLADILSPGSRATPRVVRLPLGDAGDAHLTALGVLISLTPGTLTLGVDRMAEGGRELLVHTMYDPDEARAFASLREMDRRLVAATTGRSRA